MKNHEQDNSVNEIDGVADFSEIDADPAGENPEIVIAANNRDKKQAEENDLRKPKGPMKQEHLDRQSPGADDGRAKVLAHAMKLPSAKKLEVWSGETLIYARPSDSNQMREQVLRAG